MKHLKRNTNLILVLFLGLAVLLAACGSTPSSVAPSATTTSLVKGEFVENLSLGGFALSTDGQHVIAYLCNGTVAHLSLAEWFKGTVTKNTIDITNAHGSHLFAALTPQAVTGTITLKDGRSSPLSAHSIANPGSDYGLVRSEQTVDGVRYLGGWILPPAGFARAHLGGEDSLTEPLITCCNPMDRGGIINEQTGALILTPDFDGDSVTVANLGTFRLTLCRLGAC